MTEQPMTESMAFILVPDAFTGGWVWAETTALLREAGAAAYPATLTGTDLAAHTDDVLRVLDALTEERIVLVGHGYGNQPATAAAHRRPERIARVVHVDAGLPRNGVAPLAAIADEQTRARLLGGEGASGTAPRSVPPPGPGEWGRLGSTEGVPAAALARLAERASPQPAATLTRPLRLTGATAPPPDTAILCTASGVSIALLEGLLGLGDPDMTALAKARAAFFELATGHWPMLSVPDQLAEVLLRAAAGQGHRLTAPTEEQPPAHLRPFVLEVAERPRERHGAVDLHLPDGPGPRPTILFVHGGPVPTDLRPTPRHWPAHLGYARYAAELGAVGAVVDHGLHRLDAYPRAAQDVADALGLLRRDPRVDPDRIALWIFSAGGLLAADWLDGPPPWLRCLALTYPVLAPLPGWPAVDGRFRPTEALARGTGTPPVVLTRAGREDAAIANTVSAFLAAARDTGAPVEVIDVPHGRHGFDTLDHTEESRDAVRRALHAVLGRLTA
ncbi:alpha/beta fold hydrolase [Streptomyces lichenis]|uniref:Alpha/beta fold hydrolase n=1 Tax=Streptomyces lichenis TaxID=2306967 RepID=A0ABT0IE66_9ACTN|nr:alpha/beta fold hydrolase [Streptomyces lichenis]MCK8679618.1 alpha/beta fold hydrolase [Streptomyces lichenis]